MEKTKPKQMVDYNQKAKEVRGKVLQMIHKAGTSHIASNFSLVDIAVVLYENLKEEDEVVWSKGWAAALGYVMLARRGEIPEADLDKFPNPPYLGLMEPSVNGVHVAGGSVGHGLPVAVGMALAKKRAGEPGKVYCLMSDGELNEGSTWESALIAAHHNLDNLMVIVDANGWQALGRTKDVLDSYFPARGWEMCVANGHLHGVIGDRLFGYFSKYTKPKAIIFETTKGSGGDTACDIFEKGLLYHYKHVDEETYRQAQELLSKDKVSELSD